MPIFNYFFLHVLTLNSCGAVNSICFILHLSFHSVPTSSIVVLSFFPVKYWQGSKSMSHAGMEPSHAAAFHSFTVITSVAYMKKKKTTSYSISEADLL